MDWWYLIGRVLGLLFWPTLAAVGLYGIGWLLAVPRQPHIAANIKRLSRLVAFVGFMATLFFVGRDFLRYTGTIT